MAYLCKAQNILDHQMRLACVAEAQQLILNPNMCFHIKGENKNINQCGGKS